MRAAEVTLERTMPSSLESERAVLGAVLLDDRAIFPATEVLTVDDFYLESHREIFRAMLALAEEETSIDLFTVREELRRRDKEEAAGGPAYLASLTDGLPRVLNVGHYARTVREKATSRQLIQLSSEVMSRCYEGERENRRNRERHLQHGFKCYRDSWRNHRSGTWRFWRTRYGHRRPVFSPLHRPAQGDDLRLRRVRPARRRGPGPERPALRSARAGIDNDRRNLPLQRAAGLRRCKMVVARRSCEWSGQRED